ncbi:Polyglutamine-binding protein 1 [Gryllus bimaculatus]|nr:Polyglutamine-binding protein 1 [Gryllus bimaculatus]
MPLPQFLRYRLAKRGIIHGEDADKVPDVLPPPVEEEVIAEDYDTPRKGNSNDANDNSEAGDNSSDTELKLLGHPGCPNKYNIFHECTVFCKEKWGVGHAEPDTKYQRLKQKMLQKYPLPITWMEVYDPGSGRHYYWEYESDYVSWLPPLHPRAIIAEPASMLRQAVLPSKDSTTNTDGEKGSDAEDVEEVNVERPERHKEEKERKRDTEKRSRDDDRRDWHEDERRREGMERSKSKLRKRDSDDEEGKPSRSKEDRERKRDGGDRKGEDRHREDKERPRGKGWKGNTDGALDPMDPAAYSDTPRGTWSTGLERKNEAKTGADTTAAGPLYQMRPYPSPGDVLRANSKTSEPREGYKSTKSRRAP